MGDEFDRGGEVYVAADVVVVLVGSAAWTVAARREQSKPAAAQQDFDAQIQNNAQRMLEEGKKIFRFDTFGSEDFWGGQLRLHEAIVGQKLGGVGPGVSPKTALSLGLKVDAEALPADLVAAIKAGKVTVNGRAIRLTSHEFRLLAYMMHHKGQVISRTELTEHLYEQDFDRDSNTIEVFVGRLRKKLPEDTIQTIRGLGYKLETP